MNGAQITVLCAIGTLLLLVIGTLLTVRDRATKQARLEQQALKDAHDAGYREGRASRDAEVALLTSQLGDARRDRDLFQAQSEEGWRRYNDLRDRRSN